MSTLAATKADGFYYPPDWTPEGGSASLSARLGKKAKAGSLGKRASKLGEGTLTVRFEMPFDVRCLGCDGTIARGVRFNARKKAVGKYHSTTIWSFSMRTACCSGHLEIRTDPKHAEFVIFEGAERRRGGAGSATRYGSEPALDLEGTVEVELQSREEREAMMADGMARLERQGRLAAASNPAAGSGAPNPAAEVRRLARLGEDRWADDYQTNRELRRAMREDRKAIAARRLEGAAMGLPEHVHLLDDSPADADAARAAFRDPVTSSRSFERSRRAARDTIRASSIFSGPGVGGGGVRKKNGGRRGLWGGVERQRGGGARGVFVSRHQSGGRSARPRVFPDARRKNPSSANAFDRFVPNSTALATVVFRLPSERARRFCPIRLSLARKKNRPEREGSAHLVSAVGVVPPAEVEGLDVSRGLVRHGA